MKSYIKPPKKGQSLLGAEFVCGKPDNRGWTRVYPIAKVADGKAYHATKDDVVKANRWVDKRIGK